MKLLHGYVLHKLPRLPAIRRFQSQISRINFSWDHSFLMSSFPSSLCCIMIFLNKKWKRARSGFHAVCSHTSRLNKLKTRLARKKSHEPFGMKSCLYDFIMRFFLQWCGFTGPPSAARGWDLVHFRDTWVKYTSLNYTFMTTIMTHEILSPSL